MATKTLSISEEAYINLVQLKKEGESFSQLILRITSKKGNPKTILETLNFLRPRDQDAMDAMDDLADNIEAVYNIRKSRKLRKVNL